MSKYKHGMADTTEFRSWEGILQRCYNPNNNAYIHYGFRGIAVDPTWYNFIQFYKDMGPCPEGMTLDRINNNGDYSKDNCKWSTPKEQARNRRNNIEITYKGVKRLLVEVCEELGLKYSTIYARLKYYHWPEERLFDGT